MDPDTLKEILAPQKVAPEDELPVIEGKQVKSLLRDNSSKLTCLIFIESTSPLVNYIHAKFGPLTKEFTMVQTFLLHIDKAQDLIGTYEIKQNLTMIMFNKEKEVERFSGFAVDDALTYIKEKKPNEPFSGKAHTIGDAANAVDFEEYLKSVRRETPPPPSPGDQVRSTKKPKHTPPPSPTAASPTAAFPTAASPTAASPTAASPTSPAAKKSSRARPQFLNPFSDEFKALNDNLVDVGYSPEDIMEVVLAGGAEINECYAYLEAKKEGTPLPEKLTNPATPGPEALQEKQQEIFESLKDICDPLQLLYVILYTGSTDDELILDGIEKAQSGEPLPEPIDEVNLEVQRLLTGGGNANQFSISQPNNNNKTNLDKYFEQQRLKEAQLLKEKRRQEIIAKQNAKEIIRKNRENQRREEEARKNAPPPQQKQQQQTSSRPSTARDVSKIQFRLPTGNAVVLEFKVTDKIGELETRLKQENLVPEDAQVEFELLPSGRLGRDKFDDTLEQRHLGGRIAMRVLITQPTAAAEEATPE